MQKPPQSAEVLEGIVCMISSPDQPLPSDAIDRLQKARQEILDQLSKGYCRPARCDRRVTHLPL